MCGIIGYIGSKEAKPILINGLKRLEYRGYDSCGICISQNPGSEENRLKNVKNKGRISDLEKSEEIKNNYLQGNIGIAHTRWATHGEPNKINSHPHLDCSGKIAIVHNGIIENYNSIKKFLNEKEHKIISDTDSELIANLIEHFYKKDLEEIKEEKENKNPKIETAVKEAMKIIQGAYGLAVLHKNEDKIIAARKGSPLIIGVGENKNEMFVASDIPAILDYTRNVIYLKDEEIATLTSESYNVQKLNGNGESVVKDIHEIEWQIEELEKGNFKHFMLKEIFEQPTSLENTLRGRLKEKIKLTLNHDFNKINRIIITACGTSWHSALIGKFLIENFARIPVEVDYASEFRYRDPVLQNNDLVIGISQSGETADTLAALREAKSKGSQTMGIVNVVGSTITQEVDSGVYIHAGPEIGVASTKAFTSQITALTILALYIRQEKNLQTNSNENNIKEIITEIMKIPEKVKKSLEKDKEIKSLAEKFKDKHHFLYFGRGLNYPVALEGALKLKEISYIHAEGYPAAEMKHGPLALVDEDMPCVFIATKNNLSEKIISNMQEVKARKGKIIVITNPEQEQIKELADYVIEVPKTMDHLSPIINVIPLQLLAYHIADLRGLNVDKPRNLAKSVTVE